MINDEIANKAINLEIRIAKLAAKEIVNVMKLLVKDAKKRGQPLGKHLKEMKKTNSTKLKDLVEKGQLVELNLPEGEMKELKKELNRYGVQFSVMKDKNKNEYRVFCQAKDTKVMDFAFKRSIEQFEKKEKKKVSTRKNIQKYKEKVKPTMDKDKVKNKHHSVER